MKETTFVTELKKFVEGMLPHYECTITQLPREMRSVPWVFQIELRQK